MDLAAATLAQAAVSGAPVVDGDGRCIGVVTATDFLRFAHCGTLAPNDGSEWDDTAYEGDSVLHHMSAVQSVAADTPLVKAAEIMCAQHIHRLVVLDDRAAPAGIVSTLDIMAALAAATDESRQRHHSRM
jgi:CBS domain-containing protein